MLIQIPSSSVLHYLWISGNLPGYFSILLPSDPKVLHFLLQMSDALTVAVRLTRSVSIAVSHTALGCVYSDTNGDEIRRRMAPNQREDDQWVR